MSAPDRHLSSGEAARRVSAVRMLLILTIVGGIIFVPLNFVTGDPWLAGIEAAMTIYAMAMLAALCAHVSVGRIVWAFVIPLNGMLLVELYTGDTITSFVWALLVPTVCHRLFGPWRGSAVGGLTMLAAAAILVTRAKLAPSAEMISMISDVVLCSISLFLLSLVHELHLVYADRALRERADVDSLTQLATRQRFREMAEEQRRYARANVRDKPRPASLIMTDIDFFKRVNDSFGHDFGDRVLEATAGRLLENSRRKDLLGRMGGEEMAVLLFDLEHEEAVVQAERLRRCMADTPIVVKGRAVTVTLSLGVATFDLATTPFDDMFRETDSRLYAAKHHGRNRVHSVSPGQAMPPADNEPEQPRAGLPAAPVDAEADAAEAATSKPEAVV